MNMIMSKNVPITAETMNSDINIVLYLAMLYTSYYNKKAAEYYLPDNVYDKNIKGWMRLAGIKSKRTLDKQIKLMTDLGLIYRDYVKNSFDDAMVPCYMLHCERRYYVELTAEPIMNVVSKLSDMKAAIVLYLYLIKYYKWHSDFDYNYDRISIATGFNRDKIIACLELLKDNGIIEYKNVEMFNNIAYFNIEKIAG